jgi:hypothetical protein
MLNFLFREFSKLFLLIIIILHKIMFLLKQKRNYVFQLDISLIDSKKKKKSENFSLLFLFFIKQQK